MRLFFADQSDKDLTKVHEKAHATELLGFARARQFIPGARTNL